GSPAARPRPRLPGLVGRPHRRHAPAGRQSRRSGPLPPADSPAGVALLTPDLVSGRHYARAWLAGAAEGAYLTPLVEDYFLPEDSRTLQPEAGSLPRRFSGQEHLVLQEFLFLADTLTVTYAADTQEGAQLPQPELLGSGPLPPLPDQAAASPAELRAG